MAYVTIVGMIALIQYLYFGLVVGRARASSGVQAPAVTGDADFERKFRAHQNTLEQLIIFLPALYASGAFVGHWYAVGAGLLFIVGRALYFSNYTKEPGSRGPGMLLTMVGNFTLILGGLVGAAATF